VNCEPADLADKIGYVFQNPDLQLLADTVYEEVAYGPRVKKLPEENIRQQVENALSVMGLTGLADRYPRMLSFGQKRRLGVAAALALSPRMLILDEITNGQDAAEQAAMMGYLKKLNETHKTTIILITHDMDVVQQYTARSIVLAEGEVVYNGDSRSLFDGTHPIAAWGLRTPMLRELGNRFGIAASDVRELGSLLGKGGERA